MLSNAYFLAKFRFDTAENEPAKKLQNFRKMHFRKMHFRKMPLSATSPQSQIVCKLPSVSSIRDSAFWSPLTLANNDVSKLGVNSPMLRRIVAIRQLEELYSSRGLPFSFPNGERSSTVSTPIFATKHSSK